MRNKTYLIIGLTVLIGVAFILLLIYQFDRYNWSMSYKPDDDQPYGTELLSEILAKTGEYEIVEDTIYNQLDEKATGNYIFIGRTLYMDSLEMNYLMKFVERGGHAYIFSTDHHYRLLDTLFSVPEYASYVEGGFLEEATLTNHNFIDIVNDTMVTASIESDTTRVYSWKHQYRDEIVAHNWSYFNIEIYSTDTTRELQPLGYFQDSEEYEWYLNYIGRSYGKGQFIFHTNPEVLTNFYLLDSLNYEYARRVFSDLQEGPVYFDEENQNFQYSNYSAQSTGAPPEEGPLSFVLSQPSLRWAWYLILVACLLYLIFGAKRTQRVIPVLEKNSNTSIEFAETVSQLYMRQKDHRKISMTKMKLFLAFIRERYGLKTNYSDKNEEEILIKRIAAMSEIDSKLVKHIFDSYQKIKVAYEVTNKMLVDFHMTIEHFYQNCK